MDGVRWGEGGQARQDAAPPKVAQDLLNKHRVTSRGGGILPRHDGWSAGGERKERTHAEAWRLGGLGGENFARKDKKETKGAAGSGREKKNRGEGKFALDGRGEDGGKKGKGPD